MTKVIKVKDETFESLITTARWSDTMDEIINRLLQNFYGPPIGDEKVNKHTNQGNNSAKKESLTNNKIIKSQDSGRQTISCDSRR